MTSLLHDPEQLISENEKLRATIQSLAAQLEALEVDRKLLQEKLQYFLNRSFARSTERMNPNQLHLFEDGPAAQVAEEEREAEEIHYRRRKPIPGHGRVVFPEHLPRNVIVVEPPESERHCGECGKQLVRIREEVTERGEVIPARIVVNQYVRGVWACHCGCEKVKVADLPAGVIDKGKWEASAYAHVVVSKYGDHLPLHRQMSIFKRHGIDFPKSTMWDMAKRTGELLRPVVARMREELLREPILEADETPIRVVIPGHGRGKSSRTGYMWGYRGGGKMAFDFTTNRSRAGPREFLGRWQGTLLADDYGGYDEVCRENGIRRGGCWGHGRRKLREALELGDRRALVPLCHVNRLFWIERAIQRRIERRRQAAGWDLESERELRRQVRGRRSVVVLNRLKVPLLSLKDDPAVLPKSKLGRAVRYLVSSEAQWKKFTLFTENPDLAIHNNACERQLRAIAVGRKNYQILGSVVGGDTAAMLYALIGSCKALDVNPEQYLVDVLRRIDRETKVENLTPWGWKAQGGATPPGST